LSQSFDSLFGDRERESVKPNEICELLENITGILALSTRRLRCAQLKAFFNFVAEKCCPDLKNPCNTPLLTKTFRTPRQVSKAILDRETVSEMIYNTKNKRNGLILEVRALCDIVYFQTFQSRFISYKIQE
jgi:integrase/recombinase XerD